MQEDLDIDELTQHAAKVITETAEEVVGKTPKKAKKKNGYQMRQCSW